MLFLFYLQTHASTYIFGGLVIKWGANIYIEREFTTPLRTPCQPFSGPTSRWRLAPLDWIPRLHDVCSAKCLQAMIKRHKCITVSVPLGAFGGMSEKLGQKGLGFFYKRKWIMNIEYWVQCSYACDPSIFYILRVFKPDCLWLIISKSKETGHSLHHCPLSCSAGSESGSNAKAGNSILHRCFHVFATLLNLLSHSDSINL